MVGDSAGLARALSSPGATSAPCNVPLALGPSLSRSLLCKHLLPLPLHESKNPV